MTTQTKEKVSKVHLTPTVHDNKTCDRTLCSRTFEKAISNCRSIAKESLLKKYLQQLHSIISKVHETEMHDFLKELLSQRKEWKIFVTKRNFKGDLVTFVNGISGQMAR